MKSRSQLMWTRSGSGGAKMEHEWRLVSPERQKSVEALVSKRQLSDVGLRGSSEVEFTKLVKVVETGSKTQRIVNFLLTA